MNSEDTTLPVPKPFPFSRTDEMSDGAIQRMLAAGATSVHSGQWLPPTVEELQKLLPDYEIEALIGRGGMGAVYKGTQRSLDRPVAIKILPPMMNEAGAQFTTRFKQEARAMAKLSHPHIIAIHDFGEVQIGRALGPPSAVPDKPRRLEDSRGDKVSVPLSTLSLYPLTRSAPSANAACYPPTTLREPTACTIGSSGSKGSSLTWKPGTAAESRPDSTTTATGIMSMHWEDGSAGIRLKRKEAIICMLLS